MENYFGLGKSQDKVSPLIYFVGVLAVCLGYFVGQLPLTAVIGYAVKNNQLGAKVINEFQLTNNFELLDISRNLGFVIMIIPFIVGLAFLYIVVKQHKRSFTSVLTSRPKFDIQRFLMSFAVWMALGILAEVVVFLGDVENYSLDFNLGKFLILLLICVLLLPLQTTLEEVLFRGYLAQGLGTFNLSPVAICIITSLLFSAAHSFNPEIAKFGFVPMQFYYIGAGIFLSILAYLDGGLEVPIGIHTATNIFGALLVKYEGGVLQTDAAWSMKETSAWTMTICFYLSAILFYMIFKKKYGWNLSILKSNPIV
jgi:uncharacterized protein